MKRFIYLLVLVFTTFLSMGQAQTGYVEVKGKVKHDGKALSGAEITIYQNNSKIKTVKTASNGKFILSLKFDKDYVIEFSKKSFVSKKVEFDTHVSEKQYVWPYPFTIELFSMIDGLDISAMKDPVTKIAYSKDEGDFVFDIPYTNGMKTKMSIIQNQIKTLKKNAYTAKIAAADKKFREKQYKDAIVLYEQSIDINPYTDYPDDQIMECERRLDGVENEQANYDKAIASADAYFKQKKYEIAKKDYQKAKAIKSTEKYPQDKIKEIDSLLAASKRKEQKLKYDNIIKKADALMASKDYTNAKSGYKAALNVIPTEEYPKGKIAEIDALVAENQQNAKVSAQYAEKIAEGDRLLAKREYQISKNAYIAASKIKPNEKYPKDKIKEIDGQMANMKTDQAYAKKIQEADALLAKKELKMAKDSYNAALQIKSTESYPKEKIKIIDAQLAQLASKKELDKNYSNFIKQGDSELSNQNYLAAKSSYQKALGLKAKEKYPQDKIKEIDGLLAKQAADKSKEEQYASLIKNADASLSRKEYKTAKTAYVEALKVKPGEAYPKTKISEIDSAMAALEASKAKDEQYANKIKTADSALGKKDYAAAKTAYSSALQIKPSESYPKTKIAEIDKVLESMAADKAKEEKFNNFMKDAEAKFAAKDYLAAKTAYQSALGVKPNEAYPQKKITEIDGLLAEIEKSKAKDAEYAAKIKSADALLAKKDYATAKTTYLAALDIKSKEAYPKQKVEEIDGILSSLADVAEKEKLYKDRIAAGDKSFTSQEYEKAKLAYQSALKIKSEEQYPKDKLSEISKLEQELADQKAKDKQYQEAIANGDKKLSSKDYAAAKTAYNSALQIKPNESYPKTKIGEIDKVLESMAADKAMEEKFNNFMKDAEAKFAAKDYLAAKTAYQSALGVKPNEAYPQKKITEIDGLLAEIEKSKAKDAEYAAKIKSADALLAKKDYTTAKTTYLAALDIKSKEAYPKQKIKEIDGLIAAKAGAEAKDKQYQAMIKTADNQLASKEYEKAKLSYQSALKIKSEEQYPKDKLVEISSALALLAKQNADKKALEDKYKLKVEEGDRLLTKREYQISKKAFEEASAMKPDEAYPKQKIEEINGLLAGIAKETQYAAALKEGSDYVAQKKYSDAKLAYNAASEIMPGESLPKDKIKEIDALIAKDAKAKKLAEYKRLMADAETKFTSKDYVASRELYQQASDVNPSAQYPKDKIVEIDKLLAQTANKDQANKAKKQKYASLIQKGDADFSKENYSSAKINYKNALKIYPTEAYPKDKIRQIDKLTAKTDEIPEEIDFADDAAKKKFMSTMASKYGEGVHEEKYESKSGKKVRRIIVVKDGVADEYREVKQPWGATYFFKNGKTVSRAILFNETKK